jgi:hypothetical protein
MLMYISFVLLATISIGALIKAYDEYQLSKCEHITRKRFYQMCQRVHER